MRPVTAPPIEDGAVLVDEAGRIAALGPHSRVPTPPGAKALEFRDAELVPGLINCHTHLELTHLAGKNSHPDFVEWIRRVRALKDASSAEEFRAAAEAGLRDCWARGVTCVADTGSTGAVLEALVRLGGRGIAYHEVFGPDPSRAEEYFADFERQVARLRQVATGQALAVLGVSPHAPYTVSERLYRLVVGFGRRQRLPLAVHAAESRAESELVREGAGAFAAALRGRGIEVRGWGVSPLQYLGRLGVVAPGTLCIHAVEVDEADVELLARRGAAVAHCPRSNAAHGHGRAPLAAFRAAGVPVGLGTDSVMSVPDLDLWAEARAAGLAGESALRALTLDAARALGWDWEVGSLEVGKWADLAVLARSVPLRPGPSPFALLTVIGGRIVQALDSGA
ncbi:MAG TPA: amidohydrolase family protein [Gemmatimonadales bacterium]|nr:amidohydrolase family protein [Gemmatimonadales bacterium]